MSCVFLTGMPKSGKTTLAIALYNIIKNSVILDGDELRKNLNYKGFSKKDRDEWVRKIGNLAFNLSSQGISPIVALVSPYASVRKEIRKKFVDAGMGFLLVYVKGSDKFMWEGSVYEEPGIDEDHIVIDRTRGVTDYEGIFRLYRRCFR